MVYLFATDHSQFTSCLCYTSWVLSQTNMLIDDIKPGKKSSDRLVVTPPPQRSLSLDATSASANATPEAPEPDASTETIQVLPQAAASDPPAIPAPSTHKRWSKRRIALTAGLAVVLLGSSGGGIAYTKLKSDKPIAVVTPEPTQAPTPTPVPTPVTEASRLTGASVPPELNARHVTGIMIENSPDARPQSGLLEAGVVYEAIAEGGITRFLALYQEGMPQYIGPVRSLRPYYIDWLMPYDATIAHVGGSLDALQQVKQLGLKDLDQFQNGGSYTRISSRYAPHNVYTNMGNLDSLAASKGYNKSTFTNWARKAESPATPTATSIDFDISSYLYNAHYDYDPATNSYKRSQGGKPHTDEKTGAQITPKVVIALIMPYSVISASDGSRSEYATVGQGPMFIFQDGVVTTGTWSKPDRKSRFTFLGPGGVELPVNAGQTWVSIVEAQNMVTYK